MLFNGSDNILREFCHIVNYSMTTVLIHLIRYFESSEIGLLFTQICSPISLKLTNIPEINIVVNELLVCETVKGCHMQNEEKIHKIICELL